MFTFVCANLSSNLFTLERGTLLYCFCKCTVQSELAVRHSDRACPLTARVGSRWTGPRARSLPDASASLCLGISKVGAKWVIARLDAGVEMPGVGSSFRPFPGLLVFIPASWASASLLGRNRCGVGLPVPCLERDVAVFVGLHEFALLPGRWEFLPEVDGFFTLLWFGIV